MTLGLKDWTDTLKYLVDQQNDKEHTTTGVAPNDAAYAKYEDVVQKHIEKKATFDRKYDKVNEGGHARVYKKPGNTRNLDLSSIIGRLVPIEQTDLTMMRKVYKHTSFLESRAR